MKASDLMIGDWVCLVDPDTKKRMNTKVRGIDLCGGGRVVLKWFEPLEITSEILQKIGFCTSKRNNLHGIGLFNKGKVRVEYMKSTAQSGKVIGVQFLGECGYVSKTFNLPLPKYLHELQHAFKYCGIKDEIEI